MHKDPTTGGKAGNQTTSATTKGYIYLKYGFFFFVETQTLS